MPSGQKHLLRGLQKSLLLVVLFFFVFIIGGSGGSASIQIVTFHIKQQQETQVRTRLSTTVVTFSISLDGDLDKHCMMLREKSVNILFERLVKAQFQISSPPAQGCCLEANAMH